MRNISELPDLQSRIRSSFERDPGCDRFLLCATNKRSWGDDERPHPATRLLSYHCEHVVKKRGQSFIATTPEGKVVIPAHWVEETLVWPELERRGLAAEIERGASFVELVMGRRIELGVGEEDDERRVKRPEMRQLDWRREGF